MSETRSQQEPSMEEILASIRRIISEDGQQPEAKAEAKPDLPKPDLPKPDLPKVDPAKAAGPTPSDSPASSAAEEPAEDKTERLHLSPVPSGEDEVLVLTQMVAEDGSVVSLSGQPATGDADLSAEPETGGLPDPPDEIGAEPKPPSEVALEPAMDPAPDLGSVPNPDVEPDLEAEPDLRAGPDLGSNSDGPVQPSGAQSAKEEAVAADQDKESETVSSEARKRLELVSNEAEAASTAALAELARTVSRDKDTPVDGGRLVEDLVLQAVKPMLREWLDANLPALVERVVRGEIQRMVRRAEDKA